MSVDELSWPPLTERGHAARTLAAILQHTRTGNGGVDRLSMLAAVWQDPLVGKAFSAQAGPQASLTKRLQELVPGRRPPQKWVEAANPSLGLAAGLQLVQRDIADEPLDPADLARAAVLGDGPEELDAWLEDADVDKERAAEDLAGLAAEVHTPRSGDVGTFRPENAAPEAGGIAQQPDSSLPARDPAQEQAAQPRSDSSWQRAAAATAVRLRQGNGLAHCVLLGRGLALGPAHSFGGEGQHHIRLPSGSEVPASVELRDDALDYAIFRFARDANEGAELTAMSTDLGGHWHATFEDPYTEETWTAEGEVQGWNYSQGGIRVRLGPARTESGVSGTPFFSSRGQLLGIITRGANGEAEGVPIALALWDARVRALADLPPLIQQGDPRSWVTSGGAREPTTDTAAIAKQMGIQLIENGLGLRTGGQPGTDEIVTRSMLTESVRKGAPPAIQVVRGDAPVSDFFARFPTQGVPDGATWTGTALEGTDLVVALGGGPAVRRTVEAAAARDILVLAPPRAWNGDSDPHNATHRQWGQFLSGSAMGLHRDLKAADTEKAKGILGRILSLFSNRRGGAPGHAPEAFGLANDAVGTGDLLDLEGTADRFARVMISRHMEPPLAIGLFGPWGSGKSHFMKLLQSGCERLQGKQEYVGHVAPIWFNAWHYMDRNLWASLAGNIFDGIARHLVSTSLPDEAIDRVPTFVDVRAGLTQRLSSTLEARREAERVEKTARKALADARERRDEARLDVTRLSSSGRLIELVWEEVKRVIGGEQAQELREATDEILADLGGDATNGDVAELLSESSEQLDALVAEARTTHASVRGLLTGEVNIVVLVLVALGLTLTWLLSGVDWSPLVPIAGAMASGTTLLRDFRRRTQRVATLAAHAQALQGYGSSIRTRAFAAFRDSEATAEAKELEEAERVHAASVAEVRDIEATLDRVKGELEALRSGKAVYDFAIDRLQRTNGYEDLQGIVSTVRRDLRDLSRLLGTWKEGDWGQDAGPLATAPEEIAGPCSSSEKRRGEIEDLPIQRIVLYIDDLDRCPRERVVEVLQAVHLLLAFDLFVVVVGVDARWLERSLEDWYGDLLGEPDEKKQRGYRGPLPSARPHDYLEKIFQVAFTLPQVDDDGFKSLIRSQLATRQEAESAAPPDVAPDAAGREASAEPPRQDPGGVGPEQLKHQVAGSSSITEGSSAVPGAQPEGTSMDAEEPDGAVERNSSDSEVSNEATQDAFFVEAWERAYLDSLADFLDTPRAILRFSNSYRLLRLGHVQRGESIDRRRYVEFVGAGPQDSDASYRIAGLLLAINVAFPRYAAELLRRLSRIEEQEAREIGTLGQLIARLEQPTAGAGTRFLRLPPGGGDSDFEQARERLIALLKRRERDHDLPIIASPEDGASRGIRYWAARVGRYSMYWRER